MPLKKFPYLVHYFVNEESNTVEILAVISTHRNPKVWPQKNKKE